MSIYAAPGSTFEAYTSSTTTGLVGTMGVRIVDGQGNTTLARQTTGIIEHPAGSGLYAVTLTAPTTAGTYAVVWDTGGASPTWAEEDLWVTSSAVVSVAPTGSDLCSLTDVRVFLQKTSADAAQDPVISTLITRASLAIMRYCDREFAPATTGATRTFEWPWEGELVSLAPYDLRGNPTLVQVDTDQASPYTLSSDEYRVFPLPSRDGTYFGLRVRPFGASLGRVVWRNRQIKITGNWGFSAVPDDVVHWATVTVALWLRRDVSAFSTTFNIAEDRLERPEALPSAVRGGLAHYKRAVF